MDPTWLELVGTLSLFLFATVVLALLIVGTARALSRTPRPSTTDLRDPQCVTAGGARRPVRARVLDRIDHFLREYVGNLALEELEPAGGSSRLHERRTNGDTRALLDQIIGEMDRRNVSSFERETFLEDLRRTIRSEERLHTLGLEGREAERRFLETLRWALAERFHSIVRDPPQHIVARIKSGLLPAEDAEGSGSDPDR